MLTLFAIPKPFRGHIATIQRNALRSWSLLKPQPEIILFGDDEGTAEAAAEFKVRYVPKVARNEYGTPLLNDLFANAQVLATHNLLGYVNADIILMSDFAQTVERVARCKSRFLMAGQRWDVELKEPLPFNPQWEEWLRIYVAQNGLLHPPTGIDYFIFPRGFWGEISPFAIGRPAYDNWLLYHVRKRGIPLIDATQAVMTIHQNHDYSHHVIGYEGVWNGIEAKRNLELAGGWDHVFTLRDATHRATSKGLRFTLSHEDIQRHLETVPFLYPRMAPVLVKLARGYLMLNRIFQSAITKMRKRKVALPHL